jgi:FkbM family methyltransferase
MINGLIDSVRQAVGRRMPEGKFKDSLRSGLLTYDKSRILSKEFFRRLFREDPLDSLVTKAEITEDGSLAMELSNGLKYYAQRDIKTYIKVDRFSPRKYRRRILAQIEGIGAFVFFWYNLREIYEHSIYENYYQVKKGDVVIDIGAYIGLFTLKAAKAVGDEGIVIAIEPEKDNLTFLERNIDANGLRNVVIVKKGVWSGRGKKKLYLYNEGGGSGHSLLNFDTENRCVEIEVDTLDNILVESGIKQVNFIKMDIEGAEIEAYQGMKDALKHEELNLSFAAYHVVNGKETYKTIVPWLKRDGFQVHTRQGFVYGRKAY